MNLASFVALVLIACWLSFAQANDDEFIFGPEFTFSNEDILASIYPEDHRFSEFSPYVQAQLLDAREAFSYLLVKRMDQHLVDNQPLGAKFTTKATKKETIFTSPNGWSFKVTLDDGVIEIIMSPMTVADFKRYKDNIQDAIFVSAANEGLLPYDYLGGGHISIGLEAFKNKPLLLRNFLVDLFNHSELALGVMNYDSNNALPAAMLSSEQKVEIGNLIRRFDNFDEKYWGPKKNGLDNFFTDLFSLMADEDEYMKLWNPNEGRTKHSGVNVSHAFGHDDRMKRIEIRSIRPQKNMDVFIRQIELFRERIRFLEKIDHPIPLRFNLPDFVQYEAPIYKLRPPVHPQTALRSFYKYVTESGLEWKDHTDYLWPKWVMDGGVEKFEQSAFFRSRQALKKIKSSCLNLLTRRSKPD